MRYLRMLACFLFVALCLTSCNKKDDFILISGKLVNSRQSFDVPGVSVE